MFSICHHKFTGFHVLVTSPAIFFEVFAASRKASNGKRRLDVLARFGSQRVGVLLVELLPHLGKVKRTLDFF